MAGLMLQQRTLKGEPTTIACEATIGTYHAVAWHNQSDRILSICKSNRARGIGLSQGSCKRTV